jgi:hypothetical protein
VLNVVKESLAKFCKMEISFDIRVYILLRKIRNFNSCTVHLSLRCDHGSADLTKSTTTLYVYLLPFKLCQSNSFSSIL